MNDLGTDAWVFLLVAGLLGLLLMAAFWIAVMRVSLAPLRREVGRLADAAAMQNEISLDDELRPV